MCWLFNPEFYRCLGRVIREQASASTYERNTYWFILVFSVSTVTFGVFGLFYFIENFPRVLSWISLIIGLYLIISNGHRLCCDALARLNATDTNETSSSREPLRFVIPQLPPSQNFLYYLEWPSDQGMLPHWPYSGSEALSQSYETLQSQASLDLSVDESSFTESEYDSDCNVENYFLRRATHRRLYPCTEEQSFAESSSIENEEENNLLPQVTHRDHHASTEEQSIAGCSSAENEQDSNAESNLVSEVTHRSQHPSTSAEARPITSSQFVTVAEVYRPHSEESD